MSKSSRTQLARNFVRLLPEHSHSQLIKALAHVVTEQRLVGQLDLLLKDINTEMHRQYGQLHADVLSSHNINDEIKHQLKNLIKHHTGAKTVHFTHKLDASLLGGAVVTTPELELDLSIRSKLNRLGAHSG